MNLFDNITPTGLFPIIKWAGGKEKELSFIFPNAPIFYDNYYEPFVGGDSVFTAFSAKQHKDFFIWIDRINLSWSSMLKFVDGKRELCDTYLKYRNGSLSDIDIRINIAQFIEENIIPLQAILPSSFVWKRELYVNELKKNLIRKILRMKKIEQEKQLMPFNDIFDNIETAFMSSLYMYYRGIYNDQSIMTTQKALSTAVFVFIRNYAYSGMFRYNDNGDFNVPYGGIAYNHKHLSKKIDYYKSEALKYHFKSAEIYNMDFEDFFRCNPPQENDFIFLDPPYDSEFSTYSKNEFSKNDQRRLAKFLINECKGKWMMIIKNTPFIYSLYDNPKLTIKIFEKNSLVSFMNRNDKKAEHLIIMNYTNQ